MPLAVVRTLPHLEALIVVHCAPTKRGKAPRLAISPTAPVWGELGSLRELSLELTASSVPLTLLGSLNGAILRKLALRITNLDGLETGIGGLVTDAALAGLPLLEELLLDGALPLESAPFGDSSSISFTGAGLAALHRLTSLTIHQGTLPTGMFSHARASLRTLKLSGCSGLTDASFAAPCFSNITSLSLRESSEGLTAVAFAGLAALEELTLHTKASVALISDAALAVLGSHGRLRRLRCSSPEGRSNRYHQRPSTG